MVKARVEVEEPPPVARVKREPREEEEAEPALEGEPVRKGKRAPGRVWTPTDHYCWQVAFINQVVSSPWIRCFGSLGTGFVGIRPDAPTSEGSRRQAGAVSAAANAVAEGEGDAAAGADEPVVPLDATIVIFVNAPAASLQTRGGRTIDGYKDALDRAQRTLEWSAQRSDKNSKRIEAILAHQRHGGRVVVGVRSPIKRNFRLLGQVSAMDLLQRASFVVNVGDHVIQERGTRTFHKHISAACLNNGLRSGVALTSARYPVKGKAKWCSACCYEAPKAVLHFAQLAEDGVAAFHQPAGLKRERLSKAKLEELESSAAPAKRLRVKTCPDEVIVKVEQSRVEEDPNGTPVKWELTEEAISEARAMGLVPMKSFIPVKAFISVKSELPEDPPES